MGFQPDFVIWDWGFVLRLVVVDFSSFEDMGASEVESCVEGEEGEWAEPVVGVLTGCEVV